jgi:hypothetical protein
MGQLLGEDTGSELVRIVYNDITSAIKEMYDIGIVHL